MLRGNGEIMSNCYVLNASIRPPYSKHITDIQSISTLNVASSIEFICNDGNIYRKEMYFTSCKTPDNV